MTKNKNTVNLTIEFDNQAALEHFALWLCEAGEQDYWNWMEYREREEHGDITATIFHYHGEEDESKSLDDSDRYGEFLEGNTIRTTLGRLDK